MKDGDLVEEIKVNGRVVPLKSQKLRELFAALRELERKIKHLQESGDDNE